MSSCTSDSDLGDQVDTVCSGRVNIPTKVYPVDQRQPTVLQANPGKDPGAGLRLGDVGTADAAPTPALHPLCVLASVASSLPNVSEVPRGQRPSFPTDVRDIARWSRQAAEDSQRMPLTPPPDQAAVACAYRPASDLTLGL